MLKHIYIAQPYDSKESLIKYVHNQCDYQIDKHNDNYNHLIFDDNNRLIKVVKMNPYSNDIANMSEGNVYNFKDGFPEPYYKFFCDYFDDVNIYSIILDNEQINDLQLTNKLINIIDNFNDNFKDDFKDDFNDDLSDEYIKVYQEFVHQYNQYNQYYNENELNFFKLNFIKNFLKDKVDEYKDFIYSHMKN